MKKGWHWMFVADMLWRRWSTPAITFNFAEWYPREYSVHLQIGPVLLCFGWEQDDDF